MSDAAERLKARTMKFALDVCGLIKKLPASEPGPTVRRQLAKCATGVAFNYRASCRARSHAEFTAKIGVVAEEVDEAQGWLEFTEAGNLVPGQELAALLVEASQLAAIFSASVGTARAKERAKRQ
jgi:four helix bundle protein